ncbi:unnamed protein product [Acanthoscelides obtectus]|uniref:NAD-dependent protein deacylase n=1 Tax=Acanthoscelides obtectus TaxID=200917 RepID=A0A9P0L1E2_ACAOB|nr:unnamed protein product [Acanthoscelides obtectus]CAK1679645.1 NAD-dependent protein deacylase [Acanthoscelides obtectus]
MLTLSAKFRQSFPIVHAMAKRRISDFEGFQKVLNNAKSIIVLTGAGISSESGIPTFRGEGGWWKTYRSADLATPQAFQSNPALVWEFYNYRRHVALNTHPNNAHKALSEYEKKCKSEGHHLAIITQNVDGLHKRAGSENIIELHGNLFKTICTNRKCIFIDENYDDPICKAFKDRWDPNVKDDSLPVVMKEDLPKCKKCNSLVRPYIVWFGENLDHEVLRKSRELVESCDLCLVVGTSSVVYPAAMFAPLVAQRGMPVAEFNITEEPADNSFAFHFPGKCGTTLQKALGIELTL